MFHKQLQRDYIHLVFSESSTVSMTLTWAEVKKQASTHLRHTWPPAWWRRSMRSDCRRHRRWPGCPWRRPWWPWGRRTRSRWRWRMRAPQPTPNRRPVGARPGDLWPEAASLAHLNADCSLQRQKRRWRGDLNSARKKNLLPAICCVSCFFLPPCFSLNFVPGIDYWSVRVTQAFYLFSLKSFRMEK